MAMFGKFWQLFIKFFEPDSLEEQEKDKEIQWERDQWGYPKQ